MCMKNHFGKKHQFLKEIFSKLDLNEQQKKEIEKLKNEGKKEMLGIFLRSLIGRSNKEKMCEVMENKIVKVESILNSDQKEKVFQIIEEKISEHFMQHLFMKKDELEEMFKKIDLSEVQKDEMDKIFKSFVEQESGVNPFELKESVMNVLDEKQQKEIKESFKRKCKFNELGEELGIDDTQKEKLEEFHEKAFNKKKELFEKMQKREISISDLIKEKHQIMFGLKEILNESQMKKLHKSFCNKMKSC